jgi:hypothetical protein
VTPYGRRPRIRNGEKYPPPECVDKGRERAAGKKAASEDEP